jgi:hypothetical protein
MYSARFLDFMRHHCFNAVDPKYARVKSPSAVWGDYITLLHRIPSPVAQPRPTFPSRPSYPETTAWGPIPGPGPGPAEPPGTHAAQSAYPATTAWAPLSQSAPFSHNGQHYQAMVSLPTTTEQYTPASSDSLYPTAYQPASVPHYVPIGFHVAPSTSQWQTPSYENSILETSHTSQNAQAANQIQSIPSYGFMPAFPVQGHSSVYLLMDIVHYAEHDSVVAPNAVAPCSLHIVVRYMHS